VLPRRLRQPLVVRLRVVEVVEVVTPAAGVLVQLKAAVTEAVAEVEVAAEAVALRRHQLPGGRTEESC